LFEVRFTIVPPLAAGPFRVTTPFEADPPTTDAGDTVRFDGTAGTTVNVAVMELMPISAWMVATVDAGTAKVAIENVAEVAPAATVTLDGGAAEDPLDERATTSPPVGEGPFKVMVPFADDPPTTELGEIVRLDRDGGTIVSVPGTDVPASVAVITAEVVPTTGVVETAKLADVLPAGIVTFEGAVTPEVSEESPTTKPPEPAGPLKATVPVDEVPPTT
jgi:hypothetical protein